MPRLGQKQNKYTRIWLSQKGLGNSVNVMVKIDYMRKKSYQSLQS